MRFIRCATIVLMLAGTATLAATPAFASGPVIDVTPSIAAPGTSVTFAITCGSSASSAILFGTTLGLSQQIPMQPSTHAGEFVTTVSLPTSISPGTYTPAIDCSNGVSGLATLVVRAAPGPVIDVTPSIAAPGTSVTFAITCGSSASSAILFGTTLGLSQQIPMQPSTHAGEFVTTVSLPTSISPGTYTPAIDCSNGVSGLARLVVHAVPGGAPVTGDGTTSMATGGRYTAAGIGLLGVGVLVVWIAIRRRRSRSGA